MKQKHVELSETERSYCQEMSTKKIVNSRVLKRTLALLALDRGESVKSVAEHQNVTYQTICNLKKHYKEQGLACLQDATRSGRPVEIDGSQRAKVTALACSDAPKGYSKWSLRLLADRIVELEYCESISHTQVRNILKKTSSNLT
jgi:putative transposase